MTATRQIITQEYYDELCQENAEVFELSEEEALVETEQQLAQSSGGTGVVILDHLSQTFPTSERGRQQRDEISQFVKSLQSISEGAVEEEAENKTEGLAFVTSRVEAEPILYLSVLQVNQGFELLVRASYRKTGDDESSVQLQTRVLQTLRACLNPLTIKSDKAQHPRRRELLASFHKAASPALLSWLCGAVGLIEQQDYDQKVDDTLNGTLTILVHAVKNCEANKTSLMNGRLSSSQQEPSELLVGLVHGIVAQAQVAGSASCCRAVCRLLTSLCTFEVEATPPVAEAPPLVPSANANVLTLHQHGIVPQLHQLMKALPEAASYVVLTLRALAIHNDVVKAIVHAGLLTQVRQVFVQLAADAASKDEATAASNSVELLVAAVGFFRNLCANDDVKTRLCVGSDAIVEPLVQVLNASPEQAVLQEHGCGVFAAMALRQPENAQALVLQYEVHVTIVAAMRAHPTRATLQRQAALALRNLVSRSADVVKPALTQAGAEQALLQVAAQHGSCQDEVYAALRDMGVDVNMVKVSVQDKNGQQEVVVSNGTEMFGESSISPNFRPVYS